MPGAAFYSENAFIDKVEADDGLLGGLLSLHWKGYKGK